MDGLVRGFLRDGCRVVLYWVVFRVGSSVISGEPGIAESGASRIEGIAWNAVRHAAAQNATSRRHHPIWCVELA